MYGNHIPVGANHREYRAGRMQPTAVGEGTQEGTEVSELHRGTSVMAEARGLVWRRTASHLLSHCLSTLPRASPGQGSLDQGLVKQIQQLGDTAVGDANQRRHLFIMDLTLGEHTTAQTSLCLAWLCQRQWEPLSEYPIVGRERFL